MPGWLVVELHSWMARFGTVIYFLGPGLRLNSVCIPPASMTVLPWGSYCSAVPRPASPLGTLEGAAVLRSISVSHNPRHKNDKGYCSRTLKREWQHRGEWFDSGMLRTMLGTDMSQSMHGLTRGVRDLRTPGLHGCHPLALQCCMMHLFQCCGMQCMAELCLLIICI